MPELPEVETTCRGIAPHLQNQIITAVQIRQPQLRWPISATLAEKLMTQQINTVTRRAKYLLITTDNGTLIIHLGMSGSLRIVDLNWPVGKHDHLDIIISNGKILRYNDPRRFGSVLWTGDPIETHPLLKDLGPDPLSNEFSADKLYGLAKNRKVPVKSFIMNSHVVVGVGNIYANEALFMAGLLPSRQAGKIALLRYEVLVNCIRKILEQAIEQGGTTLRDFVNETGKPGYFQQQLKVYGRHRQPCLNCGQPLDEIRIANRSTVFCRLCQR